MGRFDGKVVLVTGGNRNTGLDLVEKFWREGAKVILGDCGVINFFITRKDLKALDFSRVRYRFSCS